LLIDEICAVASFGALSDNTRTLADRTLHRFVVEVGSVDKDKAAIGASTGY
jgi:hypothetical protein